MNFLTRCLRLCSDCWNHLSSSNDHSSQLSAYSRNIQELAKHCLHDTSNHRQDLICYQCFFHFFGYDRFIIRQLFSYLKPQQQQQTDYIHVRELNLFAQRIIHWHEYISHLDFIIQLFQIILNLKITFNEYTSSNLHELLENKSIDSVLLYELIQDAFFFTAVQANVQTNLTDQSQIFLQKFFDYFRQLNQSDNCKNYLTLIKRIIPWGFISIHQWLKNCLLSSTSQTSSISISSQEFNPDIPLIFLWYLTNWLVSNKVFLNEYNPMITMEKIASQELITHVYDSDKHGYSLVTLCECTYHLDGPFLMIFSCNDQRIFAVLLEGKLMDSAKPYGGRSSLCLQLSPQFIILERGPSMLYWNVRTRSDGPLGIRIGHHGLTRFSLDLNMEHIHHPQGTSTLNRIEIYKLGTYKTPVRTPMIRRQTLNRKEHNEYNIFSIDAHKLAESIGIHLFT